MDWFAVSSPIGQLGIAVADSGVAVCGVSFGGARTRAAADPPALVESTERVDPTGLVDVAGRVEVAAQVDVAGRVDVAGLVDVAGRQLAEYFAGTRTEFDLPLVVLRGSEFERAVWHAIAAIPYGETRSYGAIARSVGQPGGAQAVGTACNRNPLPLVVPCHRVIGSDGKLVGFGGGLGRKRFLLQLEARIHIERTFAGLV